MFVAGQQAEIDTTTTSCGRQLKLITTSYKIFPQTSKTVKVHWCSRIFMAFLSWAPRFFPEKKISVELPFDRKNTTYFECTESVEICSCSKLVSTPQSAAAGDNPTFSCSFPSFSQLFTPEYVWPTRKLISQFYGLFVLWESPGKRGVHCYYF